MFWSYHFILQDGDDFYQDYLQAWRDTYPTASFVMFTDNGYRLEVPCSITMDDEQFIRHLYGFHYLIKAEGGIEALSAKTLDRIEVIKVSPNH